MLSPSFQDSLFVSQKTSCTEKRGGAYLSVRRLVALGRRVVPELWGPLTVFRASKNIFISFLSAKDCIASALLLSQESCISLSLVWTVLHIFEYAALRDTELVPLRYVVFLVFLFKESLDFVILVKAVLVFTRYWS